MNVAAIETQASRTSRASWNPWSICLIVLAWAVLQIGCLFTPGLLDDVDSIYIEIAREMMLRHDYVTPYIDGVRFFDKPPLMYWLAAGSMHLFGVHDWAARLPLALVMLALLLAVYGLGLRLFAITSPAGARDRGALYSALALATCLGPFLYTRFFIPDIMVTLFMTLSVHLFLIAVKKVRRDEGGGGSALLPCLGFAAVLALSVLSKGLIGIVFPLAFVVAYLLASAKLYLLERMDVRAGIGVFLAIAVPWHVMAFLRNRAIKLPSDLGLPVTGGWGWFYLYNEHIARFLSRRIPQDYGQVPVITFWFLAMLWLFPWTAFLPAAILTHVRDWRGRRHFVSLHIRGQSEEEHARKSRNARTLLRAKGEAAMALLIWAGVVLVFFTFSARQEYYSLPALPALALMAGGLLARVDRGDTEPERELVLALHGWALVPLGVIVALISLFYAIFAKHVAPGTDLSTLLAQTTGTNYNLSLSHLSDLTGKAMGLFRLPLALLAVSMLGVGPVTFALRLKGNTVAANLGLAAAAMGMLLAVHEGLVRFYPTLGSLPLAKAILAEQAKKPEAGDLILIDGELTAGSSLIFYTKQQIHVVNGRINGLWYGSFWPDAPKIFEDDPSLGRLWHGSQRIFLLTNTPVERTQDLAPFGQVRVVASSGGKSVLVNQP